jgi:hypothetical protein
MRHLIADDKLMARRRLDHVDAMRPVKQAGVISTHAILYFAPAAASAGSGAALLLLHVSREGFFFISACMLTYAYADLNRAGLAFPAASVVLGDQGGVEPLAQGVAGSWHA